MRMWMVDPELLCDQHLLGEHVEIHMLVGAVGAGMSIRGYIEHGLLEPQNAHARHEQIVVEMRTRRFRHRSDLGELAHAPLGYVNRGKSIRDLCERCDKCRGRIQTCGAYKTHRYYHKWGSTAPHGGNTL
jgi:hypothetical protein